MYLEKRRSEQRRQLAEKFLALSKLSLEDLRLVLPKEYLPPWVVFSNRQKLGWLNYEMKKIWPFLNEAASELIKETLDPILGQYRSFILASIKCSTVTLGTVAPQFSGITMVETGKSGATVELELQWDGNPKIELDVQTLIGVAIPVKVKNICFTGVFGLIFQPLVKELPCFGALTLSLLEKEKLVFDLKIVGGDIMAIPGLADAIEATIRDALEGSLMWPARNIIPILPGDYSNLELRPVGILEVKLLQAKNLKNKEIIGKSDPFCVIYVRPMRDRMKKSRTINNELNPVWNEHFEFEVEDISTQYLQIKIFDDGIQGSNIMGCARVKLEDLESGKLKDLWLRVGKDFKTTCDRNYRGEVHVELRYLSFGMGHESMISLTRNATTLLEKAFAHDTNGQAVSSLEYVNSSKRRHRIVRGVLSVTVKRAESLIVADLLGSSDPFVILTMKKSGSMKKTKVVPKSLNPIWDQTFHFMVEDALHDLLIVEVWDHDTFGKDSLGKCVVSLSKLILEGEYDTDLKLEGVESGQIFLHLNWKPQPYSHDDS